MPEVEFNGETFSVDEDGFIDDYKSWTEGWVQYCKKEEGIDEMTDEVLRVLAMRADVLELAV